MYTMDDQTWPQRDPMTNREICHSCWNLDHKNCGKGFRRVRGFECDCVHLSEATFAAEETAGKLARKRERRKLEKTMLEADDNPLRADNPDFGKRYRRGA